MLRRGAEILAFGLLFRLQEFLIAWGWAPWSDLLRVDVLNIIGLSMILMALLCGMLHVDGPVSGELAGKADSEHSRHMDRLIAAAIVSPACSNCLADSASLHHLATNLAALAARILHRRMPQPGRPTTLALLLLPLGRLRFRRPGRRIRSLQRPSPQPNHEDFSDVRCRWSHRHSRSVPIRPFFLPSLLDLRLLAHQS